jgi:hypothetical protein
MAGKLKLIAVATHPSTPAYLGRINQGIGPAMETVPANPQIMGAPIIRSLDRGPQLTERELTPSDTSSDSERPQERRIWNIRSSGATQFPILS